MRSFRWAILDIETTGLKVTRDKITEIAVIIFTEKGVETTWHSLINPQMPIPAEISQLTGVTTYAVSGAPLFAEIAFELYEILENAVLVAHNARFDYGFLKNAFKQLDLIYKPKVLCTLKLARALFPSFGCYKLASIANCLGLENGPSHRAEHDAALLLSFLKHTFDVFSEEQVLAISKTLQQSGSKPSKLVTDLNTLPDGPGVYLFYSDKGDLPIYIGKSVSIRQRVLSHFQADYTDEKEFKMAQQIHRVEYKETTGELSALLLESQLIKEFLPLYNHRLRRKKNRVGLKKTLKNNYTCFDVVSLHAEKEETIITSFNTVRAAKSYMLTLVKEHKLCPKLCGLEKTTTACFSYHLHRCLGACVGKEDPNSYNLRVNNALIHLQDDPWPFQSAIAIEENRGDKTNWLIFNNWQFLGSTTVEQEWASLSHKLPQQQTDRDTYKILRGYLRNHLEKKAIHVLPQILVDKARKLLVRVE